MNTTGDGKGLAAEKISSAAVENLPTANKPETTATPEPDLEMPAVAALAAASSSRCDDEPVPPGFSRLDNPDPAVEQLYDEGLGENLATASLTEPLIRNNGTTTTENDEGCCTKMRKYKGVWFLLLTLLVLVGIASGIVLGTKEDDDDDDSNETFSPTKAPTPTSPTKAPSKMKPTPTSSSPTFTASPTADASGTAIPNIITEIPTSFGTSTSTVMKQYCEVDGSVSCDVPCISDNDCSFGQNCVGSTC